MKTRLATLLALSILSGGSMLPDTAEARDRDRDERSEREWRDDRRDHHQRGHNHRRTDRNDRHDYHYSYAYPSPGITRINLSPWERQAINDKIEREYWQKCRTVAGQRYYGCGNTGYRAPYKIGSRLPPQAVVWNVPYNVMTHLPRTNGGTRYVWVDRDILLLSTLSGVVLDAVRVR